MINAKELLFVVDENNTELDPLPRNQVHAEGRWHRVSHIWVYDEKGNILCQKRSLKKDMYAGMWEAWFGGHLAPNQSYEEGALIELKEELGIDAVLAQLKLEEVYKYDNPTDLNKEFMGELSFKWIGEIKDLELEADEVDEVRWFPIQELQKIYANEIYPEWIGFGRKLRIIDRIAGYQNV